MKRKQRSTHHKRSRSGRGDISTASSLGCLIQKYIDKIEKEVRVYEVRCCTP